MEEMMDFDEFLAAQTDRKPEFYAIYDPETGALKGVYTEHAAADIEHKIKIDTDAAMAILDGTANPLTYKVDVLTKTLEISEVINLNRLNFLLFRIEDIRYTEKRENEIFLTYDSTKKSMTLEMTERLGGTRPTEEKTNKKVIWDGDTKLVFFVTDYNDPNVVHHTLNLTVNDLVGKSVTFENITTPEKFSVFTRKVFLTYILEIS